MIHGVQIVPLRRIPDERGTILAISRSVILGSCPSNPTTIRRRRLRVKARTATSARLYADSRPM